MDSSAALESIAASLAILADVALEKRAEERAKRQKPRTPKKARAGARGVSKPPPVDELARAAARKALQRAGVL